MNGQYGGFASSATDIPRVSISVVSHGQGELVDLLLRDLSLHSKTVIEVLLTVNVPEALPFDPTRFAFPVRLLSNAKPQGFGANHNAAFRKCKAKHFCVMNPDIRLEDDPFPALLACLEDPQAGIVAPLIRNQAGTIEDSARNFPTPWGILKKALRASPEIEYPVGGAELLYPDWVAGMFMLVSSGVFADIGGFDERYFLYYEDADLCARLARGGRRVVLCPGAIVIHEARRQSRRNLRYLRWHLLSMLRFFLSHRTTYLRGRSRTDVRSRTG
ncbi:MAG TPA: glycosyltransferase family 2 protein [Burkholderiales bacterium]|nr:glycosyltransferase family 2 protein [Burkholderiales bacterium]